MFKISGNRKGIWDGVPNNQAHQFKPGNVSFILLRAGRQKTGNSGLNRISDKRWRLEPGHMPQLTKLTLNKFPKP